MYDFISCVEAHWAAVIFIAIGGLFSFVLITLFVAWLFNLGRFNIGSNSVKQPFAFVLAEFFVNLINDFRHFLALIIIVTFFLLLFYGVVFATESFDEKMDAIKSITAALGGLIGSIIGYYFGEASQKSIAPTNSAMLNTPASSIRPDENDIVAPENIQA